MIFKKKKKLLNKMFLNQIALMLVGFIIIVLISIPLAKNMSKKYKVNNEIKDLQKEINDLEGRNTDLKELVKYLNSDRFVEDQARLKLNYKKPDEEVFIIKGMEDDNTSLDRKNPSYNIPGLNKNEAKKENNIIKWWKYFFDLKRYE